MDAIRAFTIFVGSIVLFFFVLVLCVITENWIRIKDLAYRIEKWMHLNHFGKHRITRITMRILRRIGQ